MGDDDQHQFGFGFDLGFASEEHSKVWDVAQKGNLFDIGCERGFD